MPGVLTKVPYIFFVIHTNGPQVPGTSTLITWWSSQIFFFKNGGKNPKISFICNTWDISGTEHENIVRWFGFAPYETSGRGQINSIKLVNVRNFGNFEIPVLEIFSGIKMDQRPGQNIDLGLYFHMEGPVSLRIKLKNDLWTKTSEKLYIKNEGSTKQICSDMEICGGNFAKKSSFPPWLFEFPHH